MVTRVDVVVTIPGHSYRAWFSPSNRRTGWYEHHADVDLAIYGTPAPGSPYRRAADAWSRWHGTCHNDLANWVAPVIIHAAQTGRCVDVCHHPAFGDITVTATSTEKDQL